MIKKNANQTLTGFTLKTEVLSQNESKRSHDHSQLGKRSNERHTTMQRMRKEEEREGQFFLQPKIDIAETFNKGQILFHNKKGPKESDISGKYVKHSMIGDQKMLNDGLKAKTAREKRQNQEA